MTSNDEKRRIDNAKITEDETIDIKISELSLSSYHNTHNNNNNKIDNNKNENNNNNEIDNSNNNHEKINRKNHVP